ncbi:MAG: Uma2 family endonuclease [Streptomycetaceae bacterium]|jgi:Uma2 family endonuclease|nr:Uma2 family endonuclease [Streptomycetaceae bacterium]
MTLLSERAATVESTRAARHPDVQAVYESLDPPEGFRVELIEGVIVMSPTPVPWHGQLLVDLYEEFLRSNLPPGTAVSFSPVTVDLPMIGGDGYVPDLVVMDRAAMREKERWRVPAEAFPLVVEVVSANRVSRHNDRVVKPDGYASGPVPLYFLIDPMREEVCLFSQPIAGRYETATVVPFGGTIRFPEPFDAELDTSIFLR